MAQLFIIGGLVSSEVDMTASSPRRPGPNL